MTGSSRGHLTLWDMRFQLAVNSTQMAQVASKSKHPAKQGPFWPWSTFTVQGPPSLTLKYVAFMSEGHYVLGLQRILRT